jgi:glycosyltransferase involved in cell wall biosynthesis
MQYFAPLITIIIAVKNARNLLAETLQSVQALNYPNIEVIVIDGNSTDGTQALIQNSEVVNQSVSEPDKGISDAFNKGLQRAKGEYINFQGAGDLLHPNGIRDLFAVEDASYQLICGKVIRVQEDGMTPVWTAPRNFKPFDPRSLRYKMSLPHQGLFTHRKFFEKFGHFDLNVRFAMDYELLLRAFHQFPKTIVRDVVISSWREGGVGQNRINEIFAEYHRIKQQHGVGHPCYLAVIDKINRLKYQVKTKILRKAY